jgi:hypothetical protein
MSVLKLLEICFHSPDFVCFASANKCDFSVVDIEKKTGTENAVFQETEENVVSSHTILCNLKLKVTDQWDGWMQKSVFHQSENTDNCLPPLFASVY